MKQNLDSASFTSPSASAVDAYTAKISKSKIISYIRKLDNTNTSITSNTVVVLLLIDIAAKARLWGYSRFVVGRFALSRVPGLQFFKVLGSGFEGGFGLKPSASRQGLFALFDNEQAADDFLKSSAVCEAYRQHAREFFSMTLKAYSCRGTWAGKALPLVAEQAPRGVIATLTRASIRPAAAFKFWKKAPSTQASLETAEGCLLAAGIGEAPLLRQATFSLWKNEAAMNAYARQGAHLSAIKAAQADNYFSESMFVRFVPQSMQGVYKGVQYSEAMLHA